MAKATVSSTFRDFAVEFEVVTDALNHRSRKILAAIVQEYLQTGEAVGSRTITRRHGIDLSPATVRNVMSDLEEVGLLKQPHTSAGRVPTDQGLRYFVDSLLKVRSLSAKEREDLQQRYQIGASDLDSSLREASRVLAELSSHTVVVVTPRPDSDVLDHLEFMRLRDNMLLAVMVGKSGHVQNKIVTTENPVMADELERINNYVNHRLSGLRLEEACTHVRDELRREGVQYRELEKRALELSAQVLPDDSVSAEVIIEGQARLLEGADPTQMSNLKALFRELEEKRHLADLLERTAKAEGIQVFIGAETNIQGLSDYSVIATPYGMQTQEGEDEPRALGTLGVIGPTRMNYSKVISLVDFTAQLVSNVIKR